MHNKTSAGKEQIRILRVTLLFSILLLIIKFSAYFLTNSVAVLSDALESIINVVAGSFALFSMYFALQPKDKEHPYGHGKIENLSAGFEGALILIAGLFIIAKAIHSFFFPPELRQLDTGLALSGIAGLANFALGMFLVKKGRKYNSILMIADGKHLISDTVSSIGLIAGLGLIYLTNIFWIDGALALVFGSIILFTGFKLVRESVSNLLDKADMEKISQLVSALNESRKPAWIDIHNLRIQKFGSQLHVDAHLTLPWYFSLEETHREVREMEESVKRKMGNKIEFFIHADPCPPSSCPVCTIQNCPHRKSAFEKKIDWNTENILPDAKHRVK